MTEYTIYKISCNDNSITDFYIGSTKDFYQRFRKHKSCCNNNKNKLYTFIREHNGWENFNMSIIEVITCETKDDAFKKEQEYIDNLKPTLNKLNAFGINEKQKKEYKKQYQQEIKYKEYKKEYDRQYREKKKLEKQLKEILSNNTSELTNESN